MKQRKAEREGGREGKKGGGEGKRGRLLQKYSNRYFTKEDI